MKKIQIGKGASWYQKYQDQGNGLLRNLAWMSVKVPSGNQYEVVVGHRKELYLLLNLLGQRLIKLMASLFGQSDRIYIFNPRSNYSNFFSIISFLDTFLFC
jgi:hypothetical protein